MKKIFFLLFLLSVIRLNAQTADDIIQKYSNAMGGLDKFKAIKTLKMTGTVSAQGNELPLTVQMINGRATRTDVQVMEKTITSAYKDGKGWKINPFQGVDAAVDVTGTELADLKSQSFATSQLMDYKARGASVELLGQEDVDGKKAYKIKLTADDKRMVTYFIDASSFMLVKSINTSNVQGQDLEIVTHYSDVKDFDGLKFSTARAQETSGQVFQEIHFDSITINVPIDEKVFDK